MLDSITEDESPAQFARFMAEVKSVADGENRDILSDLDSEDRLRGRMVQAIGRSLQPSPEVLPYVTNKLSVHDETWHLTLSATAIPHLTASVVEQAPATKSQTENRDRITHELMRNSKIDFRRLEGDKFEGVTWALYFFCKIRLLKQLNQYFTLKPYQRRAVLLPPDKSFPQLTAGFRERSTCLDDPLAVRRFVDECDEFLLRVIGHDSLSDYLKTCGLSAKSFLNAQR